MSDMYKLRHTRSIWLGSATKYSFEFKLSELLDEFKAIAKKPIEDISDVIVEIGREGEEGYNTEITLYRQRMETDEEHRQRIEYEQEQDRLRENNEYEEYLRLKKRFKDGRPD